MASGSGSYIVTNNTGKTVNNTWKASNTAWSSASISSKGFHYGTVISDILDIFLPHEGDAYIYSAKEIRAGSFLSNASVDRLVDIMKLLQNKSKEKIEEDLDWGLGDLKKVIKRRLPKSEYYKLL